MESVGGEERGEEGVGWAQPEFASQVGAEKRGPNLDWIRSKSRGDGSAPAPCHCENRICAGSQRRGDPAAGINDDCRRCASCAQQGGNGGMFVECDWGLEVHLVMVIVGAGRDQQ